MASTRRKSAAIALAVIGVAGLSLAAAAQLNITSDSLGAGSIDVGACDANNINVGYTVVGDKVTEVILTGVADACLGDKIAIQLQSTNASADPHVQVALGSEFGQAVLAATTTSTDDNTATISLGAATNYQLVEAVTGIAIVIN